MALIAESGFPGSRAVAMARLNRSTAACSAAESSVTARDTSVAVSMARSAAPGWEVGWSCSLFTIPVPSQRYFGRRDRHLWLSVRALVLNSGSRRPLAIRSRRRGERRVTASTHQMRGGSFVPQTLCLGPQNSRKPKDGDLTREPKTSLCLFRTFVLVPFIVREGS
jgi:hypothetical protein